MTFIITIIKKKRSGGKNEVDDEDIKEFTASCTYYHDKNE